MPRFRVKLETRRWDEVEVDAPDADEAASLAKLHYDDCNPPATIIWTECEEETWPEYDVILVEEEVA